MVTSDYVQGLGQYGSSICQTTHSTSLHPVSKKGIGVWQMPTLEADIANADVSWFYSWGPCMGDFHKPANTEFVPMIWGRDDLSSNLKILQDTAQHQHLLGFNEVMLPRHMGPTWHAGAHSTCNIEIWLASICVMVICVAEPLKVRAQLLLIQLYAHTSALLVWCCCTYVMLCAWPQHFQAMSMYLCCSQTFQVKPI